MLTITFTGTRKGLTKPQLRSLVKVFRDFGEFNLNHGGAKGADTVADATSVTLGVVKNIYVYPCKDDRYLFWVDRGDGRVRCIHGVNLPLIRNRIMARDCDRIVATPAEMYEVTRSGTWVAVRYGRAAKKLIMLIYPDGTVREEDHRV